MSSDSMLKVEQARVVITCTHPELGDIELKMNTKELQMFFYYIPSDMHLEDTGMVLSGPDKLDEIFIKFKPDVRETGSVGFMKRMDK